MRSLITTRGVVEDASPALCSKVLAKAEKEGFWLDITAPDDEDYRVLQEVFGFHPLTIEDVRHQNQRPKLEEYPGYSFVVLFVADRKNDELLFREHHLYVAPHYLVTVHQELAPELDQ